MTCKYTADVKVVKLMSEQAEDENFGLHDVMDEGRSMIT
jgi:hypothetical protein